MRGVSRWLSCSDFFSRQTQMLQLSAHRAGTDFHSRALGHASAKFAEREIGLLPDFRPKEWCIVLERPFRTVPLRPRRRLTSLSFSAQPFFKGRQTDMKTRGDEGLGLLASESFGQDTFPQI